MDKDRSETGGSASKRDRAYSVNGPIKGESADILIIDDDGQGGEATIEDIDAYNKLYAIAYGIQDPRFDNFEAHSAEGMFEDQDGARENFESDSRKLIGK